jgi:predicted branched-subunit amino acid permease
MEVVVVILFLVIGIMGAGLGSNRKDPALLSLSLLFLLLGFIILVGRWADFPARREVISALSNVWLWFGLCCAVIAILLAEIIFGPWPWHFRKMGQKARQTRQRKQKPGS